jgi:hypothetical protein
MPPWLKVTLAVCAIPAALYALHRLMLYFESRDWMYYRRKRPVSSRSGGGGVLGEFQRLIEPQVTHVQEEKRQRAATREEEAGTGE